ncbi:Leucine-rich repeAt [Seminavis robusta]|uniref:Leucine-rich repeAt n=1 Tax=Seminavis robusta TaxID=568900 RepID=A0A9N8EW45_9STRA|nr:Leucine-rich repeAt [Seminavis robusta]|eukprot:Sro2200_g318850.1 Leucine-rich repeAt (964) ;mRNA; r:12583-15474
MAEVASLTPPAAGGSSSRDGVTSSLVNELRRVTNDPKLDESTARFFLDMCENNVELAAVFYYEQQQQQQDISVVRQIGDASMTTNSVNGHCQSCGIRTTTTTTLHLRAGRTRPLTNHEVHDGICIACFPALVPCKAMHKFFHRNLRTWQSAGLVPLSLVTGGPRTDAAKKIRQCLDQQRRMLSLTNAGLTTLPNSLGCLQQLVFLDCSHNKLEALPSAIGTLSALQELRCHHNRLVALPDRIGKLTNLKLLHCQHNKLTDLPQTIQTTSLQDLNCAFNSLQRLPESILHIHTLQRLFLGNNHMSRLPDALTTALLPNLYLLHCERNKLVTLPYNLGALTPLRSLWVQGNQLKQLPPSLTSLTKLQQLDCSQNQIDNLQSVLRGMHSLQVLKCLERDIYQGDSLRQWTHNTDETTCTSTSTAMDNRKSTTTTGVSATVATADTTTTVDKDTVVAQLELDDSHHHHHQQDDDVPTFRVSLDGLPSMDSSSAHHHHRRSSVPPIPPPIPMPVDDTYENKVIDNNDIEQEETGDAKKDDVSESNNHPSPSAPERPAAPNDHNNNNSANNISTVEEHADDSRKDATRPQTVENQAPTASFTEACHHASAPAAHYDTGDRKDSQHFLDDDEIDLEDDDAAARDVNDPIHMAARSCIPPPEEMEVPTGCLSSQREQNENDMPPQSKCSTTDTSDTHQNSANPFDIFTSNTSPLEPTPAAGTLDLLAALDHLQELITTVVDTPTPEEQQQDKGHCEDDADLLGKEDEDTKSSSKPPMGCSSAATEDSTKRDEAEKSKEAYTGEARPADDDKDDVAGKSEIDFLDDWSAPPAASAPEQHEDFPSEGGEADLLGLGSLPASSPQKNAQAAPVHHDPNDVFGLFDADDPQSAPVAPPDENADDEDDSSVEEISASQVLLVDSDGTVLFALPHKRDPDGDYVYGNVHQASMHNGSNQHEIPASPMRGTDPPASCS